MQRSEPILTDARQEQALLRKAAEAEARFQQVIEGKHQSICEKQSQLRSQVAAAEEALRREKEAALELQTEVSLERWELQQNASNLAAAWPAVEETSKAVREAQTQVLQLRQDALEHNQESKKQLEVASSLYEFYAAVSGIRWDMESDSEGYIAIGERATSFKVDKPGSKESADALWAEIEACCKVAS
ncbi:unnamed protein product [Effrenium voratum]|uniref:Kinetochore protein Spc24 n=1 Tax=Effrenium voratum TaxID=2562239 RepID=A0AA36NGT3_9DINO|nr:unnamed protein product [Effrenium voratum]CAJ1416155.1 unnamed protein product [Effrenium voratum]